MATEAKIQLSPKVPSASSDEKLKQRLESLVAENNALRARAAELSRVGLIGRESSETSVWPAMRNTTISHTEPWPHLRAEADRVGLLFHVPHQELQEGGYELELHMRASPARREMAHAVGVIEILYADMIIARETLHWSKEGIYRIAFHISHKLAHLLRESAFEFCMHGSGHYAVVVTDLVLNRKSHSAPHHNRIDLFDRVKLGSNATRGSDKYTPILNQLGTQGHIFFGPYAIIAPGRYQLKLDVECERATQATIDIICEGDACLAVQKYSLKPGKQALILNFAIIYEEAVHQIERALEFRMFQDGSSELAVFAIACLRIED